MRSKIDLHELIRWVEDLTGHKVVDRLRLSSGTSRDMYILRMTAGPGLVLRIDTGGGPFAGTTMTLQREAEVYLDLSPHYPLIPEFIGLHPSGLAFVMRQVSGTHELATLEPAERETVCDELMDALADLHKVDTSLLDLPSFRRPLGPKDHATFELETWKAMLEDFTPDEVMLAHVVIDIMQSRIPSWDGKPVLCHGDLGPRNFMFDAGRITALVDWELAHLGDPHDDLAWWIFRGHEWLGAGGDLSSQLRRWSRKSGQAIDPERLRWYRIFALLRFYILVRKLQKYDEGLPQDRVTYFQLIPILDVKLAAAAADLLGVALDQGEKPLEDVALGAEVSKALTDVLGQIGSDASATAETRRSAENAKLFVNHLAAIDRIGTDIRAKDKSEHEEFAARYGNLNPENMNAEHQIAFLEFAMRRGLRHVHLWPHTIQRAMAAPLTPDRLNLD